MFFKLIIPAMYCLWLFVCRYIDGNYIDCTKNCACCIDRQCGPGTYFPNQCTKGCIDGYKGSRCYEKCAFNCKQCNINDSHKCTACYDGYFLGPKSNCLSECLPNCQTCTSIINCTSCKKDYYNDHGSNDCRYYRCPVNCKCENNHCTSCKNGYYNTSNSCEMPCPETCVTCNSRNDCNSCKNGHYNGYQNDNTNLPLLSDCTYTCRNSCVKCLHYDVCMECKSELYGSLCEKSCSSGCIAGSCDIQTGTCECSPNFAGDRCDRCQNGKYGHKCIKECSLGCKDNTCDKESGDCINGCILDTIIGNKCDVCSAASSLPQDQPSTVVVIAPLGTVLAVLLIANVILVFIFVVPKVRQWIKRNKQTEESIDITTAHNNDNKGEARVAYFDNVQINKPMDDEYDAIENQD